MDGQHVNAPPINVNGAKLQAVDPFTYLDTILSAQQSTVKWLDGFSRPAKLSAAYRAPSGIATVSTSAVNGPFGDICVDLDSAPEACVETRAPPSQLPSMGA
nr:unnamed protein product [Spirometra erinaceieuropaei]